VARGDWLPVARYGYTTLKLYPSYLHAGDTGQQMPVQIGV